MEKEKENKKQGKIEGDRGLEMDSVDKGITWLERVAQMAKKYSFREWLETFMVLFILGLMLLIFSHPREVVDFFLDEQRTEHSQQMNYRQQNAHKVQKLSDRLLYTYDAARVLILETHNSTNSPTGIGFLKASCTFETVNDNVMPVSNQYQNTTLSLLPFADFLFENKIWIGGVEEVEKIDRPLSYKLRGNGIEYLAASLIRTTDGAIGFLFLTFNKIPEGLDYDKLEDDLINSSWDISLLLELKK